MGQIMQRMMLTWLGEPGPIVSTRNSFKVVFVIVVSYFIYSISLEFATLPYSDEESVPAFIPALKMVGSILFSVWALYALCRTRESIRARYSIEEERCQGYVVMICDKGSEALPSSLRLTHSHSLLCFTSNIHRCEDFCCSFWCSCCTVSQIARHTGDYEEYPATCCTQTGNPPGAPFGV